MFINVACNRPVEERSGRLAFVRDFMALAGLFGTLFSWYVLGAVLIA